AANQKAPAPSPPFPLYAETAVPASSPPLPPAPTPDSFASYIYESNPNLTALDYSSTAILPPTEDAGQEYIDNITFLGDSTTYGFIFYESLAGGRNTKQVWTGFDGTMTLSFQDSVLIKDPEDGTGRTIRQCAQLRKPDFLVVTLGLNGISFMGEEYFISEYKSLITDIKALSPETTVVLQSIYPISQNYIYWGSITNDMVTRANSWVLQIAEETSCPYLDTYSVLAADDGSIKRQFESGDGIHLSPEGLDTVLEYIRTHAYISE
ncbi:MAG: hypothetical protein GX025_02030, partial [Clostridiales bacterium]|nr:hypothetical protein [Clostridiales bacterium]